MDNQEQLSWGTPIFQDQNQEPPQQENLENNEHDTPNNSFEFDWSNNTNSSDEIDLELGKISILKTESFVYLLSCNPKLTLNELGKISKPVDDLKQKYDINPSQGSLIGNIIEKIHNIAIQFNYKISSCDLYHNIDNKNTISLESNPNGKKFIFFLKKDNVNGDILFDLSKINGTQLLFAKGNPKLLYITPGWVPLSLSSSDLNEGEVIALIGDLTPLD